MGKGQEQFHPRNGAQLYVRHIWPMRIAPGFAIVRAFRVLVVERIPLPENQELADIARTSSIITAATRGAGIGHGIIVRDDCWGDRELLLHQSCPRHAMRSAVGVSKPFVRQYLKERLTCAKFHARTARRGSTATGARDSCTD